MEANCPAEEHYIIRTSNEKTWSVKILGRVSLWKKSYTDSECQFKLYKLEIMNDIHEMFIPTRLKLVFRQQCFASGILNTLTNEITFLIKVI